MLEWVAISFSTAWKWKVKVNSLSRVRLLVTPWTAAYQAPPSMGVSRQEYWSGSHCLLQSCSKSHLQIAETSNVESVKCKAIYIQIIVVTISFPSRKLAAFHQEEFLHLPSWNKFHTHKYLHSLLWFAFRKDPGIHHGDSQFYISNQLGHGVPLYLIKYYFWVCSWGSVQMRFAFKWVRRVRQIASLTWMGIF